MDQNLTPLEDFIVKGIQQRLQQVFGTVFLFTNSTDVKPTLAKLKQITGKDLQYPIAAAKLTNEGLPTNPAYRATPLLRRGLSAGTTSDSVGTYKLGLIPSESSYEITFITNDFLALRKFSKLWLMSAAGGYIKTTIKYGVGSIDVHVELDRNISIPQKEADPGQIQEYLLTTGMQIRGYLSNAQLIDQQAINEMNTEVFVKGKGQTDEDAIVHEENFAFAIRSQWNSRFGPSGSQGD